MPKRYPTLRGLPGTDGGHCGGEVGAGGGGPQGGVGEDVEGHGAGHEDVVVLSGTGLVGAVGHTDVGCKFVAGFVGAFDI